jgi:hypothetical protein
MPKAAIVILADTETPGDLGRVVNGLTTAKEFKEAGSSCSTSSTAIRASGDTSSKTSRQSPSKGN